jgi:hypothetical protein
VALNDAPHDRQPNSGTFVLATMQACERLEEGRRSAWFNSLRQCSKMTIRQALQTVGAVFEPSTGLWTSNAAAAQADADEELA